MAPTTPPRASAPSAEFSSLKTTPSSHGLGAKSAHMSELQYKNVAPAVYNDVKNHQKCSATDILQFFLTRSLREDSEILPNDLLEVCLQAALPICEDIKHLIEHYNQAEEEDRYLPLTNLCHGALKRLRLLTDLPLRQPSEIDFILDAHDSHPITAYYQGVRTDRKPDIIATSCEASNEIHGHDRTESWDDARTSVATRFFTDDRRPPTWGVTLTIFELKLEMKHILTTPPANYSTKMQCQIPAQEVPRLDDIFERRDSVISRVTNSKSGKSGEASSSAKQEMQQRRRSSRAQSASRSQNLPKSAGTRTSNSLKRSREDSTTGSASKRAKTSGNSERHLRSGMVQAACYAAEQMSSSCGRSHVINLVIIDTVVYIWWYDRHGLIQSSGIDFVLDLPYFVVLLLAFQRFELEDWGFLPTLASPSSERPNLDIPSKERLPPPLPHPTSHAPPTSAGPVTPGSSSGPPLIPTCAPSNDQSTQSSPASKPPPSVSVTLDLTEKLFGALSLVGRNTQLFAASSKSIDPKTGNTLQDVPLVAKIYWPECDRVAEDEIIAEAERRASGDPHVLDHIPRVVGRLDIPDSGTEAVRSALGLKTDGKRVCRVIVSVRLYPITDLTGDAFWLAFIHCLRCHYKLWNLGIQHRDISMHNLMYAIKGTEVILGVVIDYDLSHVEPDPFQPGPPIAQTLGHQRTGTLPFMALELLSKRGYSGLIKHQYRHDWESFIWVLVWIVCRYESGRLIANPPFDNWVKGDHIDCAKEKSYVTPGDLAISTSFARYATYTRHIIGVVLDIELQRRRAAIFQPSSSEHAGDFKVQVEPFVEPTARELMIKGQWQTVLPEGVSPWWSSNTL